MALETLIRPSQFREVKKETKRLVQRCLSDDRCVQLRGTTIDKGFVMAQDTFHQESLSQEVLVSTSQETSPPLSATIERSSSISNSKLKASRSFDNLKATLSPRNESFRRPSAESTGSFGGLPTGTTAAPRRPSKSGSLDNGAFPSQQYTGLHNKLPPSSGAVSLPSNSATTTQKSFRRPPPPPPPPKRRTAIGVTNGGAIMTAIASSSSATLQKLDNRR